ncbi:MAG: hypothetical protein LBQ49_01400 [Rickettsiales bacterium]|jgi:ribosomal protein L29|nr:hypothetical protein [Rickettsiales bacterium]
MADVKEQILNELDDLEAAIFNLRGEASASKNQTDLEVAILRKQVAKLNESRDAAARKIDRSIAVLKALK